MRPALLAAALLLLGCPAKESGPPCTTPIPSTTLYQIYCDVLNKVLCLDPLEVDI